MSFLRQPWQPGVATRMINEVARNKRLRLSKKYHAIERLEERDLDNADLLFVLRHGFVYDAPEHDRKKAGSFVYRVEGRTPNSNGRFVCAPVICDPARNFILAISVYWRDEALQRR